MTTYFIASAPANIAFLKYWGRTSDHPRVAAGPSLSMTLSQARTSTTAALLAGEEAAAWDQMQPQTLSADTYIYQPDQTGSPAGPMSDQIIFRGFSTAAKAQPQLLAQAGARIATHLAYLKDTLGIHDPLQIVTSNNFAIGTGIASSASGFAALTVATVACLTRGGSKHLEGSRLAHLARQGSGSAGRSIHGGFVSWLPEHQAPGRIIQSFPSHHWPLADTIVVLSSQPKTVPSSVGHKLASTSPLYQPRLARSQERWQAMITAIQAKNLAALGMLLEAEALEMHSVAMTSRPPIHYLSQLTTELIHWLCDQRTKGAFEAYFTVDAGPNVHIISEPHAVKAIAAAITSHFTVETIIYDNCGGGYELTTTDTLPAYAAASTAP